MRSSSWRLPSGSCAAWASRPLAPPPAPQPSPYDPEALLDYARASGSHAFSSREHWEFIEAVRKLNAGLPPGAERLRFVGIDKPIDWVDVYTKLKVGRGHDETHFGLPPDKPYRRPIMGQVLHQKHGDRVFQVMADWGKFAPMNKAMEARYRAPIGYDMYSSPFASVLMQDMGPVPTRMSNLARGYVYFGPFERLHRNTTIPGFVTDAMFEKYKDYYRIDFGRPFQSAKEVDEYFRENLWGGVGR